MKKMSLRSTKKRKKIKLFKPLLFIVIVFSSFNISLNILLKNKNIRHKEYVNFLLNKSYNKETNYDFILKKSILFVSKLNFSKPETFLNEKLNTKVKVEKEEFKPEEDYKTENYDKITSYINNTENNQKNPILYIYNTHQLETYSNQGIENTSINPNVMMASYLLRDKLTNKGVLTVVEDTNMAEFIKNTGVTHNQFYGSSRIFMQNAMKKYPSLKFFIDLHRDSIAKNLSTIEINNKKYAKILFVIGTSNKTYEQNEKVAREISDLINKSYPNLSRGIFKRYVDDWPEAYNQDLSKYSILIELGAKDNTMEEVVNTLDVLSEILSSYIKENVK